MKKLLSILALTTGLSLNAKVPTPNIHKKMEADYTLRTRIAPAPTIHNNATTKVTLKPTRPHALMKKISTTFPNWETETPDGVVVKHYHVDKNGQTEMLLELTDCRIPVIVVNVFENYSDEPFQKVNNNPFDSTFEFIYALTFTNDVPTEKPTNTTRKSSRK